jgi:CRISPR-associated protein Cmr2
MWLNKGLPVSPADTRVPTHTIFDHLYAATSILNIAVEDKPSGYLALLDIPGIQSFVGSARKAGDFWAGSWILSRVSWKTAQKLIEKYGPDVLITPSPRLNPYLVQHLVETLKDWRLG